MDEVHFQQHGSRCRMWVPPEVRDPVLCHAWTHRSVGYWGAVRLHDGKLIYRREEGMFNKETCTEFLHQFHRESTRGPRRVVVISDNAGYHHSRLHKDWRADVAERFELSFLPAASPQLNPIERVWKLTRRACLHNRYFPKLEDVTTAVEGTFENWRRGNETLRRLCAIT
jgi:transposase